MYKQISLDAPNIGELEKEYIDKAIDSGYVSTIGSYVSEFEEKFARYLEAKGAVATQSGTAAIHIALSELGIGKDDEVIVPVLTFVATVNPVVYVGAQPVFVDVDSHTWNIDPKEIEKAVTDRTKAIIPVHIYGNACDMDEVLNIAKRHNLYVIEDATESLGVKYKNRYTGTFGDMGCFSFNGNKIITTGGGGMVVSSDTARLDHIRFLVNQARDESIGYYHPEIGFNYRMTNIEAALGLAQLERLNGFLSKKAASNKIYREELKEIKSIRFQEGHKDKEGYCWLTSVTFEEGIDIPCLQNRLKEQGIPTRRIFMPVVEFPPYKKYRRTDYKNAYYIYERGLCLPGSTLNSEEDIYYVCQKIKAALGK